MAMRRRVLLGTILTLACLLLANAPASTQTQSYWERFYSLKKVNLNIDGKIVPVYYGGPEYYISDDYPGTPKYLIFIDVEKNIGNKLIGVGNATYEVTFSSSAPEVATVDEHGVVIFLSPGLVTFTVSVDGVAIDIPVEVKMTPFVITSLGERPSTEDMVRKLGWPDRTTRDLVVWPDRSSDLDNIHRTWGGTNAIEVVHWHYDEYPTLIFRIVDNNRVTEISNVGWDSGYAFGIALNLGIELY